MATETLDVVLHPAHPAGVKEAISAVPGIRVIAPATDAEVIVALRSAEILITTSWSDTYLGDGLRWIQSQSAGYEHFPIGTLRRRGITLTSASGVHIVCAEHAIGMLLTLTRDIRDSVVDMTARSWNTHVAEEVAGRTVAVLGLGAIGEAIARRLVNWEVRLIGVTRSPTHYSGVLSDVRPLTALRDACAEASILMVALPAAPETRHIVSSEALDALGTGWVINVSRGSVVDEPGLVERLQDGRLRGAGLDVTEEEPLPLMSPLWGLRNVVITPHMAGLTPRYGERLAEIFAANVSAYRGEGAWLNRVT
ncbi:MAG: D-2-hydroxyacid dehydrogenase [Chloroflexota bacterium]